MWQTLYHTFKVSVCKFLGVYPCHCFEGAESNTLLEEVIHSHKRLLAWFIGRLIRDVKVPCIIRHMSLQHQHDTCHSDDSLSLTHWGWVTHICVGNLTSIGSDNGLSPYQSQAIIWINARILFIGHVGTNFSEISNETLTFSFKKMHFTASSAKWRPFCLGLNVLRY